jgi:hypothetical protein
MARNKQSAALFEVIKNSNSGKPSQSRMETPKWWFKSRKRDRSAGMAPAAPPAAAMTPRLSELPEAPPIPQRSRGDEDKRRQTKDLWQGWMPSSHHVAMGLTAAAIFGVGFLFGQRFHPTTAEAQPVIAQKSSGEIMAGPAQPGVLNVDGNPFSPVQTDAVDPTMGTPAPSAPKPSWNDNHAPSTSVVQERRRIIGYNYVIMQSYPDEKDAQEAVQALADSGIEATVVPGPPGWAANTWYSVVGTTGFDKIRNSPEYDSYMRSVERVSNKYAGKVKFKQFSPRGYKWKTAVPAADH